MKIYLIIITMLIFASCTNIEKKKSDVFVPELDQSKNTKEYISTPIIVKYGKVNAGHRLGGDVIKQYPENTIEILKAAITMKVHEHKSFKYWEFDVHETKDNILVVHHDKDVSKGKYIKKMNYADILKIKPSVPTYHAVMKLLSERSPAKIAVEVKSLISDKGRDDLINTVNKYRMEGNSDIHYLAFKKKFKKSFPKKTRKAYCKRLKYVMRARVHRINLCD